MKKKQTKEIVIVPGPLFWFLGLLFIALKLTGSVDWSWWVVLLPLYWAYAAIFGIVALVMLGVIVAWIIGAIFVGVVIIIETIRGLLK